VLILAPAGLNFDVSPLTLGLAAAAAFAFYYYTVEEGEELLDNYIDDPLTRGADAGGVAARAIYRDWLKPISPKSLGRNARRFGKWLT
jgi:hypothetical protein